MTKRVNEVTFGGKPVTMVGKALQAGDQVLILK